MTRRLSALCLIAALACGACAGRVPGRLGRQATNPALVREPFPYGLAVELPKDDRPPQEHTGLGPETTFFLFALFYFAHSQRGNLVTSPTELGPSPVADLHGMTIEALQRSRVFREVAPAPAKADFLLRATVHHLFAARFVSSSVAIAVSKNSADARASSAKFAPFGNVIVSYELVDRRGGKDEILWRDTVAGMAVGNPAAKLYAPLPGIAGAAAHSLLARLARALHLAVERIASREKAPPPPVEVRDGFQFFVQRTGPTRTLVEILTIEHPSGRVVGRREITADSLPPGRPGDWLLSRRLPNGEAVTGERYLAMAKALAKVFDLRRVDDAYYLHFFGKKGLSPIKGASPPMPEPPPPVQ